MECIYHNELFLLIISLFTFVERQKKGENNSEYTEGFFSFISAVYVQIFHCSFSIFIFPVKCWREWCITTAGDISHSSVSRCLWNCQEIIVIPWLFPLLPPIDYNSVWNCCKEELRWRMFGFQAVYYAESQGLYLTECKSFALEQCSVDGSIDRPGFPLLSVQSWVWVTAGVFFASVHKYRRSSWCFTYIRNWGCFKVQLLRTQFQAIWVCIDMLFFIVYAFPFCGTHFFFSNMCLLSKFYLWDWKQMLTR